MPAVNYLPDVLETTEAERLATVYLQSLEAQRKQFNGRATVRTLAPATTFVLADHGEHDADLSDVGEDAARFVVLNVVHTARNNINADATLKAERLSVVIVPVLPSMASRRSSAQRRSHRRIT